MLPAKSGLPLVFLNKILLGHIHIHLFIVCGCFCAPVAELSNCGKDHITYKPKICTLWPFTEVCQHLLSTYTPYYAHNHRPM